VVEAVAAIVLAGGRSSRMGRAKATLPWHGQSMVARTVGILARTLTGPILVVRAPCQALPPLSSRVEVVEDERERRGPLEGLAAGFRVLEPRSRVAYVSSTDVPFLRPAFVGQVIASLDPESDIAVPDVEGRLHPLAAAYRTALLPTVDALLREDELRLTSLLERARTRRIEERDLRAVDPQLESLINVNDAAAYERAAALPAPGVRIVRDGTGPKAAMIVHAATLGAAAAAVEVELGGELIAAVNGMRMNDPDVPLVEGDSVVFTTSG
jgi:molybdopterin-guanine dinucleotide biosynthesis protein A